MVEQMQLLVQTMQDSGSIKSINALNEIATVFLVEVRAETARS